jgi:hypothetical protein
MENIRKGDPFDTDTMIGAQASREQYDKILSYINIAREEGAKSSPAARTLRMITITKWLLYSADLDQRREPYALLPGGDLRAGYRDHHL